MLPLLGKHRSWCAQIIILAQLGCSLSGGNESPLKMNGSVCLHSFCQGTAMLIPALQQFQESKYQSHLRDMNYDAIFPRLPTPLPSSTTPPVDYVNNHFLQIPLRKVQAQCLSKYRKWSDILPRELASSVLYIRTPWNGVWVSWGIFFLRQMQCK